MAILSKPALAALFCGLSLCVCSAQQGTRQAGNSPQSASTNQPRRADGTLTADDGLAVISAALDPKVRRHSGNDCSHLVHTIYQHAGFPYVYATSYDLYDGVARFQRVDAPQTGDLIVWPGHTGIVVRPSRHIFFSFKSAGPGIDDYESKYWRGRGRARFYRYVKSDRCPGCTRVSKMFGRSRDAQDREK
jgi:cell wall-associated NlpC family hydrolase